MPNWKKLIVSGSDASLNSLSVTTNVTAQSFTGSLFGTSSFANTASFVTTLNQTVLITGSLGVGVTSLGSTENTLVLGPAPAGGSGEGGQILLQAQGGSYTSASMLDNYQNKFRLLRGTNAGSDGYKLQVDLQTGQLQLPNYNSTSAFTGTTLVGFLGFDSSGNILTAQTSSAALSGGSTNYVARWASSIALTTGSIFDSGSNVGIGTTTPESISSTTTLTINGSTGGGAVSFQVGGVRTGLVNGNDNYLTIQSYASRPLSLGYNGNNTIVVNTSNNVGIGTTSPSQKLHVEGSAKVRDAIYLGGNTDVISASSISGFMTIGSNQPIRFTDAGSTEFLRITTGGNVGIGTTSPSYKLDVVGATNTAGLYSRGANIGFESQIAALGTNGAYQAGYYLGATNTVYAARLGMDVNSGDVYLGIGNTGSLSTVTYFKANGNVGIGTTSPGAKLHVASGEIRVDAGQAVTLDTGNVMYLVGASSQLRLYNGGNPIVNITTGGNVGIGTTSPSQVLEVQGQAQIGNDNVTSAGLFIARKNSNQAKSHYFLSAQESPTYQWIEGGYFTSELAGVSVANNSGKPYYEAYSPAGQYKTFGFINQQTSGSSFTSTAATASMVLYQGGNIALAPTQGNVGIGTYSPTAKLEVIGEGSGSVKMGSTGFGGDWVGISLSGTLNTSNYNLLSSATNASFYLNRPTGGDMLFRHGNSDQMIIKSGGNVGIGTTSPSTKLHVVGTGLFTDVLTFAGDTRYGVSKVYNSSTGDMFGMEQVSAAQTGTGAATRIFADDASNNYISLGSYTDATTFVDRLKVLTNNGNVGIGTSSPTQKLDVAGAISVSGSVVDYEVAPGLIGPGPAVNIISFTPGTHYAAFVDYVIKDASTGANQRVGTIQVSISLAAAAAVLNEVTTVDIGNTSAITFAVAYGAPTWLTATNSGITPYDINYMVRYF